MTTYTTELLSERHARARSTLRSVGLDALVVSHLPNVRYLTGFESTAGLVLISGDELVLLVDGRYLVAVDQQQAGMARCPGLTVRLVERTYEEALANLISERTGSIGFEAAHMTVATHARLAHAHGSSSPRLVPSEGMIESLRVVKDTAELAVLRDAARRLSDVAEAVLADLGAGRSEQEVARGIEAGLGRMGFAKPAFDTIVASGPGSALPHARAGDRRLAHGDLVVLDFGGVLDGYAVDLTRVASIGDPVSEARQLFDAVLAAHAAAVASVRPGEATVAVDAAARTVLEERGFGKNFVHGTGHGLGLEVHEGPRVGLPRPPLPVPADWVRVPEPERLEAGMVFTIEPGAYVPGFGGVRIEDDVLVTAEGLEILTTVGRDLRVC
jgi:Xaa-Pro aminopeptidase